jgi:Rha family phage regulatory protein
MNDLVKVEQEQVVTSSRKIAETFGKEHKNVIQSIENIKAENQALTHMFYETTYKAGTGKNYKEFLMNRDGFTLLVMGFTGKKAMEWKLKYIQAFNEMEAMLKNQANHDLLLLDKQNENLALQNENLRLRIELKKIDMSKPSEKEKMEWNDSTITTDDSTQDLNVWNEVLNESSSDFTTLTKVAEKLNDKFSKKFKINITAKKLKRYLVENNLAKQEERIKKDGKEFKYIPLVDDYFIRNNIARYDAFEYAKDKFSVTVDWNIKEAVRYFTTMQRSLFMFLKSKNK